MRTWFEICLLRLLRILNYPPNSEKKKIFVFLQLIKLIIIPNLKKIQKNNNL
jgi:hypothetical protein